MHKVIAHVSQELHENVHYEVDPFFILASMQAFVVCYRSIISSPNVRLLELEGLDLFSDLYHPIYEITTDSKCHLALGIRAID